ncbi:hypothetical protein LMG29542_00410 [Paraburkholderia humisilvae]|uniref:Uncharacterized protein n=1 Tax=Paraburkholderia humisilvae TaxID=627669 RepID=A0A6J5D281_9BURK|nr:hypothetical protein LMG29542_00410 [Paraburkholderia humisilvae]
MCLHLFGAMPASSSDGIASFFGGCARRILTSLRGFASRAIAPAAALRPTPRDAQSNHADQRCNDSQTLYSRFTETGIGVRSS